MTSDGLAPAPPDPTTAKSVNVVYIDNHGYTDYSHRIFDYLFPHAALWSHASLDAMTAGTTTSLICFRTAVAGAPGMSIHRNGGYAYHHARTWPQSLLSRDPARYVAEHGRFVDYFLQSLVLPTRGEAQSLIDAATNPVDVRNLTIGDGRRHGNIVIINRKKKRVLRNIEDLAAAARSVGGGRNVITADWADLSTREQAALALGADIVIAIHGGGTINSIFMRPGAAWIDLLPPRALHYAATFMSTAQRLGVRWFTLPLREKDAEADAHDQPFFDADVLATKAFIALALGTEARRL